MPAIASSLRFVHELLLQVDWATHNVEAGCFVTFLDDCHRRPCMSEGGCGAFWLLPVALARLRDLCPGIRNECIHAAFRCAISRTLATLPALGAVGASLSMEQATAIPTLLGHLP